MIAPDFTNFARPTLQTLSRLTQTLRAQAAWVDRQRDAQSSPPRPTASKARYGMAAHPDLPQVHALGRFVSLLITGYFRL